MNAVEVIRKIVEEESKKIHILEIGVITSLFSHASSGDRDNYEVNVKLKNRDLELRKVPVATQHIGLTYIPNIGDLVLVSFVNGNINSPVVLARLFSDEQRPPENQAGEIIYESPDPKKSGLKRLQLTFKSGVSLCITDDDIVIKAGKTTVSITNDGDISIGSNASMDLKAKGDLTLSGRNVTIKSDQALDLSAGTTGKLEATATLDLKGAMVNIN